VNLLRIAALIARASRRATTWCAGAALQRARSAETWARAGVTGVTAVAATTAAHATAAVNNTCLAARGRASRANISVPSLAIAMTYLLTPIGGCWLP